MKQHESLIRSGVRDLMLGSIQAELWYLPWHIFRHELSERWREPGLAYLQCDRGYIAYSSDVGESLRPVLKLRARQ